MNEHLTLEVLDAPGAGGASHHYQISSAPVYYGDIRFQQGPIQEHGVNGISNEVLLAIVRDRLESFQAGPYACEDNATALAGVMVAMEALQQRTRERVARGVEGTGIL